MCGGFQSLTMFEEEICKCFFDRQLEKGNYCFIGCTSLFASICINIHINMPVSTYSLRLWVYIYIYMNVYVFVSIHFLLL